AQAAVVVRLVGEARYLVAREAHVTESQLVLRKAALEVGFEPAIVLHAIGQGVADDAHVIAGPQLELGWLSVRGMYWGASGQQESKHRKTQGQPNESEPATLKRGLVENRHYDRPRGRERGRTALRREGRSPFALRAIQFQGTGDDYTGRGP